MTSESTNSRAKVVEKTSSEPSCKGDWAQDLDSRKILREQGKDPGGRQYRYN